MIFGGCSRDNLAQLFRYRTIEIECLFCTLLMFSVILDVVKIGYPIDKWFCKM